MAKSKTPAKNGPKTPAPKSPKTRGAAKPTEQTPPPKRRIKRTVPPPPPPDGTPPPPDVPLNDNEARFVAEYLMDRNATHAYLRMFPHVCYDSARNAGSDMRCRPHVAREIDIALRAQCLRTRISADGVLREVARVAFSDIFELFDPNTNQLRMPRQIPFEVRRAIMSIRVNRSRTTRTTENGQITTVADTVLEYKFHPKMDALGKLARHLGLDTEITPLDALLRMLPHDLASSVRASLTIPQTARSGISRNGHPPRVNGSSKPPT